MNSIGPNDSISHWEPHADIYRELLTYGDSSTVLALLGTKMMIGVLGICLNVDLTGLIISNDTLRGRCNVLLAINASCTAVYELSFVAQFFLVLAGDNFSLHVWDYALALPIFMKFFAICLLVFIALDRLGSMVAFKRTLLCRDSVSLAIGLVGCSLVTLFIMVAMWSASQKSSIKAAMLTFTAGLLLNVVSICCYLALFISLRRMGKYLDTSVTQKVAKSLYVLMSLEVFGWFCNSAYQLVQHAFWHSSSLSTLAKWEISTLFGFPLCIVTALNGPVMYLCSEDYKHAYRMHIRRVVARVYQPPKLSSSGQQILFTSRI